MFKSRGKSFREQGRLGLQPLENRMLLAVALGGEVDPPQGSNEDASGRFADSTGFYGPAGELLATPPEDGCAGLFTAAPGGGYVSQCSGIYPGHRSQDTVAQFYDRNGKPLTEQFLVNEDRPGLDGHITAFSQANGNFTLFYAEGNITYFRRYSADGTPLSPATPIGRSDHGRQFSFNQRGDFAISYLGVPYRSDVAVFFVDGTSLYINEPGIKVVAIDAIGRTSVLYNFENRMYFSQYAVDGTRIRYEHVAHRSASNIVAYPDGHSVTLYTENGLPFLQERDENGVRLGAPLQWPVSSIGVDRQGRVGVGFTNGDPPRYLVRTDAVLGTSQVHQVNAPGETSPIAENALVQEHLKAMEVGFFGRVSNDGPASATNTERWKLFRNAQDVSDLIESVVVQQDALGCGDQASISFSAPLAVGNYRLLATDSIGVPNGGAIDGNYDGLPGGDFERRFSIVPPVATGPEARVNQHTAGEQRTSPSSLANTVMLGDGSVITTWASEGQDGDGWGVYARILGANGIPSGDEFLVNETTAGQQRFSTLAADPTGGFLVTWSSSGQDGDGYGVYARRFNAQGEAISAEFPLNTYTFGDQTKSSVAFDATGDFIVAWESKVQDGFGYGVYARRFASDGTPLDNEFRVNETILSDQRLASVAMNGEGASVVTWSNRSQDGSGYDVYARRYSTAGQPLSGEERVNSTTAGHQKFSRVVMDEEGDYWVTWMSDVQDGDGYGVYARRFASDGQAASDEFLVNQFTVGHQQHPAIGRDDDNNVVLTWASQQQDGDDWGVYARRFNWIGRSRGDEFPVNTTTEAQQNLPSIGVASNGEFTIVWNSESPGGDSVDVFLQRYLTANATPVAAPGGPYAVAEGGQVQFDASGSFDPDVDHSLTFSWDVNGDGEYGDAVGQSPSLSWAQLNALGINDGPAVWDQVSVRVTDSKGAFGFASTLLQVNDAPPATTIAGPASTTEGATYSLTLGTVVDHGADTVTMWTVHWGDGTSNVYNSRGAKTHTYLSGPAQRTMTVDLTNEDGTFAGVVTRQVNVLNSPPLLTNLAIDDINENEVALLQGSILEWSPDDTFELIIDWGDGSEAEVLSLPANTKDFQVQHRYLDDPEGPAPLLTSINVTLRDVDGGSDVESLQFAVNNVAPQASISGAVAESPIGEPIQLSAVIDDPGTLDVFAYDWRVERQGALIAAGTNQAFTFTPSLAGTYVVRLNVLDDDGGTGEVVTIIQVIGDTATPGDTNGDGDVDIVDLNNVRNNFGGTGLGDTDGDGDVDVSDLNAVRNNFGIQLPSVATSFQLSPASERLSIRRMAHDAVFGMLLSAERPIEKRGGRPR